MPRHKITLPVPADLMLDRLIASDSSDPRKRLFVVVRPDQGEITYRVEVGDGMPTLFDTLAEAVAAYNDA